MGRGLWGSGSNKDRVTGQSGTFKRCGACRGTGRARGMGASNAKCGRCRGGGMVKK